MPRPPADRAEILLALLLTLAYGWFFVYSERVNNPNEMVRLYMVRAIVHEHRYAIGRRVAEGGRFADHGAILDEWGPTNDQALVCDGAQLPPDCAGTLYSGKAPGATLLAVPLYVVERAVTHAVAGREPTRREMTFIFRLLLLASPSVLMWLALRRFLVGAGVARPVALAVVLAGGLGSLSLTYGQLFAGHQLAALALALAFLGTFAPSLRRWRGRDALVGLGLALSVAMDYESAPAALLLFVAHLRQRRPDAQALAELVAAGVLALLPAAHFHAVAFGAPWRTGLGFLENRSFAQLVHAGSGVMALPTLNSFGSSLFSPFTGLFYWAPWTALSLLTPLVLTRRGPGRLAGCTAASVVFYYLAFQVSQTMWRGGWVVGPRYVTPLVPFAAVAVGLASRRVSDRLRPLLAGVFGGAAAAAICATGLASSVSRGFPGAFYNPLVEAVAPLLAHRYLPYNPLGALGVGGLTAGLPYFAALGLAIVVCLLAPWKLSAPARARAGSVAVALVLAAGLTGGQWLARRRNDEASRADKRAALLRLAADWEPPSPPGAIPWSREATP